MFNVKDSKINTLFTYVSANEINPPFVRSFYCLWHDKHQFLMNSYEILSSGKLNILHLSGAYGQLWKLFSKIPFLEMFPRENVMANNWIYVHYYVD